MAHENVRCLVCDTVGKWTDVDQFKYKPTGMHMCEKCAFITYPETYTKLDNLNKFYEDDYRKAPTVDNLFAGERKLHYHGAFLNSLFEKWSKDGLTNPKVLEIGAAFGLFLKWFKKTVPGADIHGTELTTTFRNVAWSFYQIYLAKEPNWNKKYDLICSYKVAEHIPNIDEQMRKYALSLNEGGHLYIGVPTWFNVLNNFGQAGYDLEYYFHKNHINVWSQNTFEIVLKKAGFKIIQHNHTFYDSVYLCVRDDSVMNDIPIYDNPEQRLKDLATIKEASDRYMEGNFADAVALWPNFPEAHKNAYESRRGSIDKEGFDAIKEKYIDPAIAACPDVSSIFEFAADICMRYEKFNDALRHLQESLNLKPNNPPALVAVAHCYRQMGIRCKEEADKTKFLLEAIEVLKHLESTSQQNKFDAITWMMQDCSQLQIPQEVEEKHMQDANSINDHATAP